MVEKSTPGRIFSTKLPFPDLQNTFPGISESIRTSFDRTSGIDQSGNVTIGPRQVFILPTRFGLTYALMLVSMLVGSNNYGINLGFMLTFLLAGIGLSAMIQTWRNLANLGITPGQVQPVFCGDTALFTVNFHNERKTGRPAIQVQAGETSEVFSLQSGESLRVECPLAATRRGYLEVERFRLETWFPMGLFRAWAHFKTDQKCLVYPAPAPPGIPLDEMFDTGIRDLKENDDNVDFTGHREYRKGDNIKRLDWKALARGRGALIKQYSTDEDDENWLRWDQARGRDAEEKLSVLCRAVIELSALNKTFGLELPGEVIEPGHGPAHREECLTALALYRTDGLR